MIPKAPLDWLILFRQQINEIFNFLSEMDKGDKQGEADHVPLLDIFDTPEAFMVEIEMPGFDKSDISLAICCNTLVVEGVKKEEPKGKQVSYICMERRFGRFIRTVEIPPGVDLNRVSAKYDKGILVLSIPRMKDRNAIVRSIPIE